MLADLDLQEEVVKYSRCCRRFESVTFCSQLASKLTRGDCNGLWAYLRIACSKVFATVQLPLVEINIYSCYKKSCWSVILLEWRVLSWRDQSRLYCFSGRSLTLIALWLMTNLMRAQRSSGMIVGDLIWTIGSSSVAASTVTQDQEWRHTWSHTLVWITYMMSPIWAYFGQWSVVCTIAMLSFIVLFSQLKSVHNAKLTTGLFNFFI